MFLKLYNYWHSRLKNVSRNDKVASCEGMISPDYYIHITIPFKLAEQLNSLKENKFFQISVFIFEQHQVFIKFLVKMNFFSLVFEVYQDKQILNFQSI